MEKRSTHICRATRKESLVDIIRVWREAVSSVRSVWSGINPDISQRSRSKMTSSQQRSFTENCAYTLRWCSDKVYRLQ